MILYLKKEGVPMTIQQCRYAIEIAKTGSFSEAAKQLFVAQSSLSVSIKALEQELGIRIFADEMYQHLLAKDSIQ